jgi:hypothetical protein
MNGFKNNIKDTVVSNLKKLHTRILNLHEGINDKIETPITSFVKYSVINENIINLIDREVVYSNYPKITSLANNYTNMYAAKECFVKRVVQKFKDKKNNVSY